MSLPEYPSDSRESDTSIALRQVLDSYVECNILPGAILSIYDTEGNEVWSHISPPTEETVKLANESSDKAGYGPANTPSEYHQDSLMRIYSMTKPVTAAAILIAATNGLLALDDPVEKFLPAFSNAKVYVSGQDDTLVVEDVKQKMTIRHLLTHTSGLSYAFFGVNSFDLAMKKKYSKEVIESWFTTLSNKELCDAIATVPLLFHPGEKFHYGLSFDVLGHILEVIYGKELDEVFQETIFQPLDMFDTFFYEKEENLDRLVTIFEVTPGFSFNVSNNQERIRNDSTRLKSGGGGLVSTVNDYSKFATFLLNKGIYKTLTGQEVRLISESLMEEFNTNQFENKDICTADLSYEKSAFSESVGRGTVFGFGVYVVNNPSDVKGGKLSSVGEYGWGGVGSTNFTVDPVRKFSALFFTQLIYGAATYPIRIQLRYLLNKLMDELRENSQPED